jgi:hypothetical protein
MLVEWGTLQAYIPHTGFTQIYETSVEIVWWFEDHINLLKLQDVSEKYRCVLCLLCVKQQITTGQG